MEAKLESEFRGLERKLFSSEEKKKKKRKSLRDFEGAIEHGNRQGFLLMSIVIDGFKC